jgi:hypothetical protein
MALTTTCLRFLLWAKKTKGVSFEKSLTLGHLENLISRETAGALASKDPGGLAIDRINWEEKFADSVFSALGATEVASLDSSDYEKAVIIHDLNLPLGEEYTERFSAIIDGGTLEHVFNYPVAIQSCMKAIKTGGHFIGFSPANNHMGHGLYQVSPELMFRIFSAENGFETIGVFLVAADFSKDTNTWYEVMDPAKIGERVTLSNRFPTYMMVLARKLSHVSQLSPIYQSDYVQAWNNKGRGINNSTGQENSLFGRIARKIFGTEKNEEDLEKINPLFFKKRIIE